MPMCLERSQNLKKSIESIEPYFVRVAVYTRLNWKTILFNDIQNYRNLMVVLKKVVCSQNQINLYIYIHIARGSTS